MIDLAKQLPSGHPGESRDLIATRPLPKDSALRRNEYHEGMNCLSDNKSVGILPWRRTVR